MADVPAKLNYNESIRRIPEKVNEILDYLKRTRIQVDPRTMRKNETPAGITLSAQRQTVATPPQQLPEDGYTGYFKVVNASEYDEEGKLTTAKVRIVNGAAVDQSAEHVAGTVLAYSKVYNVAAATIPVIGNSAETTYVYLRFKDISADNPFEFVSSKNTTLHDGIENYLQLARIAPGMASVEQVLSTSVAVKIGNPYLADFYVAPAGDGKIQVASGETDVGIFAGASIATTSDCAVYLVLNFDKSKNEYTMSLSLEKSEDAPWWKLAQVAGNHVVQSWTDGAIYWGMRFLL